MTPDSKWRKRKTGQESHSVRSWTDPGVWRLRSRLNRKGRVMWCPEQLPASVSVRWTRRVAHTDWAYRMCIVLSVRQWETKECRLFCTDREVLQSILGYRLEDNDLPDLLCDATELPCTSKGTVACSFLFGKLQWAHSLKIIVKDPVALGRSPRTWIFHKQFHCYFLPLLQEPQPQRQDQPPQERQQSLLYSVWKIVKWCHFVNWWLHLIL